MIILIFISIYKLLRVLKNPEKSLEHNFFLQFYLCDFGVGSFVLGIEPNASHVWSKCLTADLNPLTLFMWFLKYSLFL